MSREGHQPGALRSLCAATAALALLGLPMLSADDGAARAAAAAAKPQDIAGVWQRKVGGNLRPMDGSDIPFTPAGRAAYEKNVNGLKDGSVSEYAISLCTPPGVVRAMGSTDPFEIVQAPGVIAILLNDIYRVIRLDVPHSEDVQVLPSFMGEQVAHWEGDTLVIDTLGVNPHTWLDASGLPHGYDLHTVEHLRKLDGGKQLENVITIEDGEFYSKPWTIRYVYEPHAYVSMATATAPCDVHTGVSLP